MYDCKTPGRFELNNRRTSRSATHVIGHHALSIYYDRRDLSSSMASGTCGGPDLQEHVKGSPRLYFASRALGSPTISREEEGSLPSPSA